MTRETEKEQRTRLAAGLIGCAPEGVQPYVRLLRAGELAELTADIDWLVSCERAEAALDFEVTE